jgi:Uma2 family endonuclease
MWDEMWEGVLHMAPMPNREHQDLEWAMETYLRLHWARPQGTRVYHNINVASPGGWPNNYRIPDLVLLTPERFGIDQNEYFEGAPDVVVEIRSPGDESYEKREFYAQLGVPEVWIIDRDRKTPEIYTLRAGIPSQALSYVLGRLGSSPCAWRGTKGPVRTCQRISTLL